jgi:hypothetical protein
MGTFMKIGAFALLIFFPVRIFGQTPAGGPIVTNVTPSSGWTTQWITLEGENLIGVTGVLFNGVNAAFGDTMDPLLPGLVAVVPTNATTGPITVVTEAGSFTTASPFQVVPVPAPVITQVSPNSGWAGQTIFITGDYLIDVVAVFFNGVRAELGPGLGPDGSSADAIIPTQATTGPITVQTGSGSYTTTAPFEILPVPAFTLPSVTQLRPESGLPGTTVVIDVQPYQTTPWSDGPDRIMEVRFNGIKASFSEIMVSLFAVVPFGASTGPITLVTPEGSTISTNSFAVPLYPVLTGFNPDHGTPGTVVQLLGTNLDLVTSANLGALPVQLTHGARRYFTVPPDAVTGPITIQPDFGGGPSSQEFTVTHDVPVITRFSPTGGTPGTVVDIQATFPAGSLEQNPNLDRVTDVWFGGTAASFFVDRTNLTLKAMVPAEAVGGPIMIATPNGESFSTDSFLVFPEAVLTGFSPEHGPPGSNVQLYGTNLDRVVEVQLGRSVVPFGLSETGIEFTVPTNALSGPITIRMANSFQSLSKIFTVDRAFDLAVAGSSSVTNASAPGVINYAITVSNQGPEPIRNVVLTNWFFESGNYLEDGWQDNPASIPPSGDSIGITSAAASQGQCVVSGQSVRCELGELAAFGKASASIAVQATRNGVVYCVASAQSDQIDPNRKDNQWISTSRLMDPAEMAIRLLNRSSIEIRWPAALTNLVLQSREQALGSQWIAVSANLVETNGCHTIQLTLTPKGRVYRLIER